MRVWASRGLTAEFLASVGARSVGGRCLPYGEGITYWPVIEVIKQLDALPSDPAAAASIRSLLRETDEAASAEEIAWAFRKLLEEQAPLICVFDDIQWGEETFLDLVEHLALLSTGAPILILCLARRELAERRREWPVALMLGPLPEAEVERADPAEAHGRPPREDRPRLRRKPPLRHRDGGDGCREPTARSSSRQPCRRCSPRDSTSSRRGSAPCWSEAAIEGEIFHRGAVQALSGSHPVTPRLASLVRKDLIRPDKAQIPTEDAFRFRHILIRDAAYGALTKATRAELHERFAGWLEQSGQELVELDEIVGYHLEQAYRYRAELGPADEHARTLASRAGERLGAAGRRALARWDLSAGVGLLERAAELLEHEDARRLPLLVDLGEALTWALQLPRAEAVLEEAHPAGECDGQRAARGPRAPHYPGRSQPTASVGGGSRSRRGCPAACDRYFRKPRRRARAREGVARDLRPPVRRLARTRWDGGNAPRPRARRARGRHTVPGSDQDRFRPPPRRHVGAPFRGARRSGGQPRLGRGDREPSGFGRRRSRWPHGSRRGKAASRRRAR